MKCVVFFLLVIVTFSCSYVIDKLSTAPIEVIYNSRENVPFDSLNKFANGEHIFNKYWKISEGLGPFFNNSSCGACHSRPFSGGSQEINFPLVIHTPMTISDSGGSFFARYELGHDGLIIQRHLPKKYVVRATPSLYGIGLLNDIADSTINQYLDSMDIDQDGISGRIILSNTKQGRFGWKGAISTLGEFVTIALENEIGISSDFKHNSIVAEKKEISLADFNDLLYFLNQLPAIKPVIGDSFLVRNGKDIFCQIGCIQCHRDNIPTQSHGIINPYTDLLVHDLGAPLDEQFDEFSVKGSEFRTAPLWGIRLKTGFYLHDGSARTISDAIKKHDGEAERSKKAWMKLSNNDKEKLLFFLNSI